MIWLPLKPEDWYVFFKQSIVPEYFLSNMVEVDEEEEEEDEHEDEDTLEDGDNLLLGDGDNLLLEDGDNLLLEDEPMSAANLEHRNMFNLGWILFKNI